MRAAGQWNDAWNPFFELDPGWTDEFMATGVAVYGSGVMSPKVVELLSIAFDASYTHMYAPGTLTSHQISVQAGRNDRRDHKRSQTLRRAGRPGVQPGCPYPGRGACEKQLIRRRLLRCCLSARLRDREALRFTVSIAARCSRIS